MPIYHDLKKVWQTVLGELEVTLSKANFTTWFKNTQIIAVDETNLIVSVPNTFAQEWLKNKYHKEILEALRRFYPKLVEIDYRVSSIKDIDSLVNVVDEKLASSEEFIHSNYQNKEVHDEINPNYTFENFVIGGSNRLAHAAALAVANNPGTSGYNPYYIYGGVGLGKTHLLQAIGNDIKKKFPTKTVLYAPCEKFTSEFVLAIQNKRMDSLKGKYRNVDVLLIDDIQFLSGKEGTQEEFFHTFNTLHQTNRQIVMTSDTKPQSIPRLEPRLSSRLGWGMVADIRPPDFETREAILKNKCQEKSFTLEEDVIAYIAKNIQSNIRDIEGILNKIIAHCQLYDVSASLKLIETILKQSEVDRKNIHLNSADIAKTISDFFSIELNELLGKRRHKELVYPRQILMYLLRFEMNYSYPKIGKAIGGKDHTTVIHGVEKIEKELAKDEILQRNISLIKEKLYTTY